MITRDIELPDGRIITIESGKLARQSHGSVLLRTGNTMLLATVVSRDPLQDNDSDFLLLSVDYQEKFSASGKIPGGFLKREGRLGDQEILVSRLVDRAIRPLFPKDYCKEIQVNISLLSVDDDILPDALVTLSASLALMVSPVPFSTAVSAVRVARVHGDFVVNPSRDLLAQADLNLMVAATGSYVVMVEGEMDEVQEDDLLEAINHAHDVIKGLCRAQDMFAAEVGTVKESFVPYDLIDYPSELKERLQKDIYKVIKEAIPDKVLRKKAFQALQDDYDQQLAYDIHGNAVAQHQREAFFLEIQTQVIRDTILSEGIRLDGRSTKDIRNIEAEIDYLPSTHGSALFTRGETQSLATVTLGGKFDEQIIDSAMEDGYRRFMLHYNFPGFSTGEVKGNRSPTRREIGHGNLAMRALKAVLPDDKENLYTIRIVADTLESNGSSSMATICASSLALMDAGIPIRSHVAGIAMGLITQGDERMAILSDILGDEDHLGDMDFKVAGTRKGITACQMDIKIAGISSAILSKALDQAKQGRLHIIDILEGVIAFSRPSSKPHAPKIVCLEVDKDMVGALIGPGGKVIQEIQKETDTSIDIQDLNASKCLVKVFANYQGTLQRALDWIESIVAKPIVGRTYKGRIKSVLDYGAFLEFMPGRDGFLHISEVREERIDNLSDVLNVGEELLVKLVSIDQRGKFRLTHKGVKTSLDA